MNIRKIISTLTLVSVTGVSLTGCIGESSSGNTSSLQRANVTALPISLGSLNKADLSKVQRYLKDNNIKLSASSDGFNDNDIAANIARVDVNDEPSSTYIYTDNHSDYDVSLVGCENAGFFENHLESSIPGKSIALRTINYNQKWKGLDSGAGIFESEFKFANYLSFNNTTSGDNIIKCYYRVDISDAGPEHSMYFTLVNHVYSYSTFMRSSSETSQVKAAQYLYDNNPEIRNQVKNFGYTSLVSLAVPWQLYNQKYSLASNKLFLNNTYSSQEGINSGRLFNYRTSQDIDYFNHELQYAYARLDASFSKHSTDREHYLKAKENLMALIDDFFSSKNNTSLIDNERIALNFWGNRVKILNPWISMEGYEHRPSGWVGVFTRHSNTGKQEFIDYDSPTFAKIFLTT